MDIPVLLLAYNRPDQTEQVLTRLKNCGVKQVYASVDGPKNSEEKVLTNLVRAILSQEDIVFKVNSNETKLGCKEAVSGGINWFFEHVVEGIILEDDCLPSEHFFLFVEDMLNRYRDNEKVKMISGNNPLGQWHCDGGHFFSRVGHVWGWATWKDRWTSFDINFPRLENFVDDNGFQKAFGPTDLAGYRQRVTRSAVHGEIDTWDYQWNAHILIQNGLAVIPKRNLVENIGFEDSASNDSLKPNWICNSVSDEPILISEHPIRPEREYEMEWSLARSSNQPGSASSKYFENFGKSSDRKLRILSVNSTDIGGGAEYISLLLHKQLLKTGHDSKLLAEHKKSDLDSVEEIQDWNAQIKTFKPDVIHIHNLHGTSVTLESVNEISEEIPTVFTLHDSWLATGSKDHPFELQPTDLSLVELRKWRSILEARKSNLKGSKIRFTAPSQWMRELFYNQHGIRPFYVPNAVDRKERNTLELPSQRYILLVANKPETNPYKDYDTLKKAWLKANDKLCENGVDLVVVGGSSKSEEFGNYKVQFLEKLEPPAVRDLMREAILIVHPSKQDNCPLTILEAHSCTKPVVASFIGGIPELLSDQESDWLYQPQDEQDLCEKLVKALSSNQYSDSPNHPSVKTMADTYLGHYLDMANG